MKMLDNAKWVALCVGCLAGLGWCAERDGRLRAEGRAEIAEAVADSLTFVAEVAKAGAIQAGIRADSVRAVADSVVTEAQDEVAEIRSQRPALVDTIVREAGPDSTVVREAVERVAASYEAEISELQRVTAQQVAVIKAQDVQIRELRAQVDAQESLIAALRAVSEARQGARQGWLSKTTEKVALVGAGVAAGYLAGELWR